MAISKLVAKILKSLTYGFLSLFLTVGCAIDYAIESETLDSVFDFKIENSSNGQGNSIDSIELRLGETYTMYAVMRDKGNDKFVKNAEASWALIGGLGELTIASDGISAQFTAQYVGSGLIVPNQKVPTKQSTLLLSPTMRVPCHEFTRPILLEQLTPLSVLQVAQVATS